MLERKRSTWCLNVVVRVVARLSFYETFQEQGQRLLEEIQSGGINQEGELIHCPVGSASSVDSRRMENNLVNLPLSMRVITK